jgi:hypothetical protein
MKKFATRTLTLTLIWLLSACTTVTQVEGEQRLGNRLSVQLTDAWNKFSQPSSVPYEVWTQEGIMLDQLRIWAAIKADQALIDKPTSDGQKAAKVPVFKTDLRPDQWVGLLETAYASDGSVVTMEKVEPSTWAGAKAVRFEFSMTRKYDDLNFRGVGWATVQDKQFFAAVFTAPRLHFYQQLMPKAEAVIKSARFIP